MNVHSIDDMSTALHLSRHRIFIISLELMAAAIHPLPCCFGYSKHPTVSEHYKETLEYYTDVNTTTPIVHIAENIPHTVIRLHPWDSVLSVLMFARLYLIGRFIVLHSRLFRTMLSYSLGALAHTKYNLVFVFKSYMAMYKGYLLVCIGLTSTFLAAWCIYISDDNIYSYDDALWVVGITFFTVGKSAGTSLSLIPYLDSLSQSVASCMTSSLLW